MQIRKGIRARVLWRMLLDSSCLALFCFVLYILELKDKCRECILVDVCLAKFWGRNFLKGGSIVTS